MPWVVVFLFVCVICPNVVNKRCGNQQAVREPAANRILSGYTPFLYGFRISSPLSGPETVSGFRLFTTQVVGKPLRRSILSTHV